MKVIPPSLGIVSLVGASGDSCFLPAEAVAVSVIRGGRRTGVESRCNVRKGRRRNVRHIISENIDRVRRKMMVFARAKYTKGVTSAKAQIRLKSGKTSKGSVGMELPTPAPIGNATSAPRPLLLAM